MTSFSANAVQGSAWVIGPGSLSLGAVVLQTRTPSQLGLASCSHAGFVLAAEGWMVPDPCGKETHRGYKEGALPRRAFTSITEFKHPRGRVLFLCTAIYFGGDSNPSDRAEDGSQLTASNPAMLCVVAWGKGNSQGTENQKFAPAPCSVPGPCVPAFPAWQDSFNNQSYTQPPSESTAPRQKRLHSCSSHFSNVLLLMNRKNNMAKCADFCSFPLFCWN